MVFLAALASSALYGAGDFLGGLASKRASTAWVVAISQASGLLVLVTGVGLLAEAEPMPADFGWGAAAGLSGTLGVALLYRALAIGTMGVVAPITAVCAVALPVLVSIARGQRPSALALTGIALAMVAIVLVSQQQPAGPSAVPAPRSIGGLQAGVPHALLSGVAIGIFFIVLAEARAESGLWPLVGARGVAVPACLLVGALGAGTPLRATPRAAVLTAAAAGIVDMTANVLYLLASRLGSLPVVVTLSSLYPASTVVLARLVLGERLHRTQTIGMLCALIAVALIVAGSER
jgi:drug/metabolite transporter (DMT)-like permease